MRAAESAVGDLVDAEEHRVLIASDMLHGKGLLGGGGGGNDDNGDSRGNARRSGGGMVLHSSSFGLNLNRFRR